jgi:hypothetical protein
MNKSRITQELLTPLVESGLSAAQIARTVGVSQGLMSRKLRLFGLPAFDGRKHPRPGRQVERVYFSGYVMLRRPEHPHADKRGRVMEHRLVMEQMIGRVLEREEIVHHMNHVRDDNRPENLMLMADQATHGREHYPKGKPVANGNEVRWRKR